MKNLTNNETNLLKLMNDEHDFCGISLDAIKPFLKDIDLTEKQARGVISSLIKKQMLLNNGFTDGGSIDNSYSLQLFVSQYMVEEGLFEMVEDMSWEDLLKLKK